MVADQLDERRLAGLFAIGVEEIATNETPTNGRTPPTAVGSRAPRWSLLKAPAKQSIGQLALLGEVAHANKALYRAFLLKKSCGCSTSSTIPA